MTILEDKELRSKIEALILSENRYLNSEEIVKKLGLSSRSFLSYRGINITEVNKTLGYIRRPSPDYTSIKTKHSKKDVIANIISLIRSEKRYVTLQDVRKILPYYVIGKYGINIHQLNLDEGYFLSSSMAKIDISNLTVKIRDYISKVNRYVPQIEICEYFKVSLSFLTKSKIDTVSLNAELGFNTVCNYFEITAVEALRELNIQEICLQKTFKDCRSKLGFLLRFDLYIPTYNLLLELDGSQHWDETHEFYRDNLIENDSIKEVYAKINGYNFARIKFKSKFRTKEYLKAEFLELLKSLSATTDLEMENVNA